MENEKIDFNVDDQHFRCFSHIMNLAVQDVLKLLNVNVPDEINFYEKKIDDDDEEDFYSDDETDATNNIFSNLIYKVRSTSKKIRNSEQLKNRLNLFCDACNLKCIKLTLDVKTRWDSSYDMLYNCFKLKSALNMMWDNCTEIKQFKLSDNEWFCLEKVLNFLKNFKYISKVLGKESDVTLPTVVIACNMIIDKIESIVFQLDGKDDRSRTDETLLLAFQAARDKILKHYKKCNWVYCVALILDPKHKIEYFDATTWGRELKKQTIEKFERLYKNKYYAETNSMNLIKVKTNNEEFEITDDCIDLNSIYLNKKDTDSWRSEIDSYYQASRATADINILEWWKNHAKIYPNLAKMARDILSTTASSVPVERFFSEGSLVMTNKRNALKSTSMKNLMCMNSWMKSLLKIRICEIDF